MRPRVIGTGIAFVAAWSLVAAAWSSASNASPSTAPAPTSRSRSTTQLGLTTQQIDASDVIWKFFSAHKLAK